MEAWTAKRWSIVGIHNCSHLAALVSHLYYCPNLIVSRSLSLGRRHPNSSAIDRTPRALRVRPRRRALHYNYFLASTGSGSESHHSREAPPTTTTSLWLSNHRGKPVCEPKRGTAPPAKCHPLSQWNAVRPAPVAERTNCGPPLEAHSWQLRAKIGLFEEGAPHRTIR
jgi:hypothetical protein